MSFAECLHRNPFRLFSAFHLLTRSSFVLILGSLRLLKVRFVAVFFQLVQTVELLDYGMVTVEGWRVLREVVLWFWGWSFYRSREDRFLPFLE